MDGPPRANDPVPRKACRVPFSTRSEALRPANVTPRAVTTSPGTWAESSPVRRHGSRPAMRPPAPVEHFDHGGTAPVQRAAGWAMLRPP